MNSTIILLTYLSCNYRSVLVCCVLFFLMIGCSLLVVLIKKISIHQQNRECAPLFFFLGETTGCQSVLYRTLQSTTNPIREKKRPEKESILHNISFLMHQFHL